MKKKAALVKTTKLLKLLAEIVLLKAKKRAI
jgi:hypothetical protein